MAKQYYGVNLGQHLENVQEGSADLGTDVQVVVDLTNGLKREEVLRLLEGALAPSIVKDKWPPA